MTKNSNAGQQIIHNLIQIMEICPQYKLNQHWIHILRTKGNAPDPYTWSEEFLLSRCEKYYDELISELSAPKKEEDL